MADTKKCKNNLLSVQYETYLIEEFLTNIENVRKSEHAS
jgi:hypothetical protein